MGPTPVYGARAEKPLQNAYFAMKQTNICRLSGDINEVEWTESTHDSSIFSVILYDWLIIGFIVVLSK